MKLSWDSRTMYLSRRFCFFDETFGCWSFNCSLSFSRLASLSFFDVGNISAALVSTGAVLESRCLFFCLRWRGTNFGMVQAQQTFV